MIENIEKIYPLRYNFKLRTVTERKALIWQNI